MTIGEIPTHLLPDGRWFIAESDAREFAEVRAFVERLSNYWRYDFDLQGWVSPASQPDKEGHS